MKNSFLLYALILSVIMNVFMYMYFSKQTDFEKQQHAKTKIKLEQSAQKIADANYFSLAYNENAQNYFDNDNVKKPIDYQKLIPLVTETLMDFNSDPKGNKYSGQDQIGEQKFIINKAHIINHRWIIADFNDGNYWGEVLLKYFVDDNKKVEFETINALLYQK
jgi:hypothetical protein